MESPPPTWNKPLTAQQREEETLRLSGAAPDSVSRPAARHQLISEAIPEEAVLRVSADDCTSGDPEGRLHRLHVPPSQSMKGALKREPESRIPSIPEAGVQSQSPFQETRSRAALNRTWRRRELTEPNGSVRDPICAACDSSDVSLRVDSHSSIRVHT